MQIKATISKWGNSLGLRINQEIATSLSIQSGSQVELILDEKKRRLTIKPVTLKKSKKNMFIFKESDLIKGVKKEDFQGDLLANPLDSEIVD